MRRPNEEHLRWAFWTRYWVETTSSISRNDFNWTLNGTSWCTLTLWSGALIYVQRGVLMGNMIRWLIILACLAGTSHERGRAGGVIFLITQICDISKVLKWLFLVLTKVLSKSSEGTFHYLTSFTVSNDVFTAAKVSVSGLTHCVCFVIMRQAFFDLGLDPDKNLKLKAWKKLFLFRNTAFVVELLACYRLTCQIELFHKFEF